MNTTKVSKPEPQLRALFLPILQNLQCWVLALCCLFIPNISHRRPLQVIFLITHKKCLYHYIIVALS